MRTSLEDERRALLEQIEASRLVYRRMLTGDRTDRAVSPGRLPASRRLPSGSALGIRQWVLDHPLIVAAGVAIIVGLSPYLVRRMRRRKQSQALTPAAVPDPRAGTTKAIATALILLLRDPQRLQTTARIASAAWQWLRRRNRYSIQTTQGRKTHV